MSLLIEVLGQMPDPITTIAGAIKEGLSLWKSFINTRESAYNRKMDKKLRKALEYGEKFILTSELEDSQERTKKLKRYKNKFFKYN